MADGMQTIGGYKLRGLPLQTGQVSQVFEVIEPLSGRHFAMKILLPEHAGKSEVRAALFHEAEVGIKLRHEHVIQIVKIDRSADAPFFIMEFFKSGSLRSRLLAKDTAFLREQAGKIFKHSATGLAYMNEMGYVHCDVKPDNMLVNASGDLKIIDFAISKQIKSGFFAKLFHKKQVQGTRSYMSPEAIRGELLDGRADIYSYGATLFELTTGRPPFRGATQNELLSKHLFQKPDSPAVFEPDLTDEFCALVMRMLAKRKEDRPRNFHEVLMALRGMRIFKSQPIKVDDAR